MLKNNSSVGLGFVAGLATGWILSLLVIKDNRKMYINAKTELMKKLTSVKVMLNNLDKQKYTAAVTQIVDKFKESGQLTTKQLEKLKNYLLDDYQEIKKQLSSPSNNNTKQMKVS